MEGCTLMIDMFPVTAKIQGVERFGDLYLIFPVRSVEEKSPSFLL